MRPQNPIKEKPVKKATRLQEILDLAILKRLYSFLKRRRALVVGCFVSLIIWNIASVLHPYLIKQGVDKNVSQGDSHGLIETAIMLALALLVSFLFQALFNINVEKLGQTLLFDIRCKVFAKLTALQNRYYDRTPVGTSLTKVTSDIEAIKQFISEGIITVFGDLLKIFFIVVAMVAINWRLALMSYLTFPIFIGATLLFRRFIREGYRGVRLANSEINRTMVESLTGIKELNLLNAKSYSIDEFEKHNRHYLHSFLKIITAYSMYFPIINLISSLNISANLIFTYFYLGKYVALGEIMAFFLYSNMIFMPLRELAEKLNTFQSAMAASERVFDLLDKEIEIKDPPQPVKCPSPLKGRVEFKHVYFAYHPKETVLEDVSFVIEPGEKVAVVGQTGSGKSTLIHLINRLYDIQRGEILIDGIDVRHFKLSELRRNITTVPQSLFLFSGTIAQNISLFNPDVALEKITWAAKQARINDYIESLPKGYESEVKEEGKSLSLGQKQLLAFARALVTDPAFVILDEATSSVDSVSEEKIEAAFAELVAGRTALVIAHRLSTIKNVDRILVMHHGRLTEQGTHAQLLKQDGIYKKLYEMQALALAS